MKRLEQAWYNGSAWPLVLTPLEALYKKAVAHRHRQFKAGKKPIWEGSVPVIVVGRICIFINIQGIPGRMATIAS